MKTIKCGIKHTILLDDVVCKKLNKEESQDLEQIKMIVSVCGLGGLNENGLNKLAKLEAKIK